MAEPDPEGLDGLATEAARLELADLDRWTTSEIIAVFADDHARVAQAVRAASEQVVAAIDIIAERLRAGGRLIYVGAGTGGRLAALDAAEVGPTYGLHGRIVAVFAGGADAMVDGREFHEDDAERAAADVRALSPTAADVVLGVSASGRTPYVLAGVAAGRDAGAYTIGFACVAGSPLAAAADAAIEVTTGAEIISGSTRLNAGSAQKLVLNAISTIAMVRLGRTFGNLMVDVVPDNGKLRRRALRALAQATGLDDEQAGAALDAAGGDTKAALVAVIAGISPDHAKRLLKETDGYARVAIARAEALAEGAD